MLPRNTQYSKVDLLSSFEPTQPAFVYASRVKQLFFCELPLPGAVLISSILIFYMVPPGVVFENYAYIAN